MRRIAHLTLDFCRSAHEVWAASKGRWWYIAGSLVLAVIFKGPAAFARDRIDNVTALLNVPDQLWGKWLVIIIGFCLVFVGMWRSKSRLDEIQATSAADQDAARAHEIAILATKKKPSGCRF